MAIRINTRSRSETFTAFFREAEPRLRRALTAVVGADAGKDAAAEALAYGWEHWDRVGIMENPVGYLYRVGRSKARNRRKSPPYLWTQADAPEPWCEPGLRSALASLSDRQRVAVMLIHGFEYTPTEIAALLGVKAGTVHKHAERGLRKIRTSLEVSPDD